jgi:putative DNA primase/helicase
MKANGYLSSNGNGTQAHKPRIVATYDYHDANGKMIFQVCRKEPGKNGNPKDFLQRQPDPQNPDKWIWKMAGVEYLPYRLPEVLKAKTVFICEGEKDCDRLAALGLVATTNAGGAGKWRKTYTQYFPGKAAVILPDNDEPGKAHALDVARNLHGVADVVRILELPGLPEKGDVSDWLKAGGTVEQLKELADAAPDWEPPADPSPAKKTKAPSLCATGGFNLSDLGNARRLVAQHGQDLRYCHLSKKWWPWTGKVWQEDHSGVAPSLAKQTVGTIYVEAAAAGEDFRKALASFALRSESTSRIAGMLSLAESEPGIPITPDQFDTDPWLLNCLSGTIDLKSGELRPHNRADLITRMAAVEYDPKATCPLFLKFLNRIMGGNLGLINFLQKILGYSLTGSTREQCLFFLYGLGANGKSTLLEVVQSLWGDYATRTSSETFLAKKPGGIPNDVAALRGARLAAAVEVEQGRRLAEVLVKEMTGGDTISARFMRAEWFSFKPQFKIFLATNHKPIIRGTDFAIWRRIRLIPFTVQIPKEEQDRDLPEKLRGELPGILNWAMAGCLQWRFGGLEPPKEVDDATQDYRAEMDVLGDFIAERCILDPGADATAAELYKSYTSWAEENGEKRPLTQRAFGMSLTERGFERGKGTGNKGIRLGIGVRE